MTGFASQKKLTQLVLLLALAHPFLRSVFGLREEEVAPPASASKKAGMAAVTRRLNEVYKVQMKDAASDDAGLETADDRQPFSSGLVERSASSGPAETSAKEPSRTKRAAGAAAGGFRSLWGAAKSGAAATRDAVKAANQARKEGKFVSWSKGHLKKGLRNTTNWAKEMTGLNLGVVSADWAGLAQVIQSCLVSESSEAKVSESFGGRVVGALRNSRFLNRQSWGRCTNKVKLLLKAIEAKNKKITDAMKGWGGEEALAYLDKVILPFDKAGCEEALSKNSGSETPECAVDEVDRTLFESDTKESSCDPDPEKASEKERKAWESLAEKIEPKGDQVPELKEFFFAVGNVFHRVYSRNNALSHAGCGTKCKMSSTYFPEACAFSDASHMGTALKHVLHTDCCKDEEGARWEHHNSQAAVLEGDSDALAKSKLPKSVQQIKALMIQSGRLAFKGCWMCALMDHAEDFQLDELEQAGGDGTQEQEQDPDGGSSDTGETDDGRESLVAIRESTEITFLELMAGAGAAVVCITFVQCMQRVRRETR